ncbi:MAG: 2-methylaconitate cis-trans isomerase PrpF [Pseudomonadota bacterium]|nr:2-methylaconitate cis-trans isomerase PrpF [Pseudomonadota bacterium]
MSHNVQIKIPATYMRGGTSKGTFFILSDLPEVAQRPGPIRDQLLMRVVGSPDPYGKQIDGMGGATSSTSKTVILSRSEKPGHDVDYLFGQVAIDRPFIDWSGNCGNLTAAVGSLAISRGLVDKARIPENGVVAVRIWQRNIKKTLVVHVPVTARKVQETGNFELDGVTFPAAEMRVDFLDPADGEEALFPTGNLTDPLEVPGIGSLTATMINAGIPTIFLNAGDLGCNGTELQDAINGDSAMLQKFETIRAHGALKMGLIDTLAEAAQRQHTPKIAFVAPAKSYSASSGRPVSSDQIDLLVRALSMGALHHAMMGTAAVAIGAAAVIPGTLVNLAAGGGELQEVEFGHPSGTMKVGAAVTHTAGEWQVTRVSMSRSARILMEGAVHVPVDTLTG